MRLQILNLRHLFNYFLIFLVFLISNTVLLFGQVVEDKLSLRINEKVYFESDINVFKNDLKIHECIVGLSTVSEYKNSIGKNFIDKLIFNLKLSEHIEFSKFSIKSEKLEEILNNPLKKCHLSFPDFINDKNKRNFILGELFLQENLLGLKTKKSKREFIERIKSLLDKKYSHFIYE